MQLKTPAKLSTILHLVSLFVFVATLLTVGGLLFVHLNKLGPQESSAATILKNITVTVNVKDGSVSPRLVSGATVIVKETSSSSRVLATGVTDLDGQAKLTFTPPASKGFLHVAVNHAVLKGRVASVSYNTFGATANVTYPGILDAQNPVPAVPVIPPPVVSAPPTPVTNQGAPPSVSSPPPAQNNSISSQASASARPKVVFSDGVKFEFDGQSITCALDPEGKCKFWVNKDGDIVGITGDFKVVNFISSDCQNVYANEIDKGICSSKFQFGLTESLQTLSNLSNSSFPKAVENSSQKVTVSVVDVSTVKSSGVLAYASVSLAPDGRGGFERICDVYLVAQRLNRRTSLEVKEVILHEMGHCFGLGHSEGSIMNANALGNTSFDGGLPSVFAKIQSGGTFNISSSSCVLGWCNEDPNTTTKRVQKKKNVVQLVCDCKSSDFKKNPEGKCERVAPERQDKDPGSGNPIQGRCVLETEFGVSPQGADFGYGLHISYCDGTRQYVACSRDYTGEYFCPLDGKHYQGR